MNHFVLLDHIDQSYVWLIDLSKNKFYYRSNINFFGMSWTEGTVMLISSKPITLPAGAREIPSNQLAGYTGASGWSCTYKIQSFRTIYCKHLGDDCFDIFQLIYERWGCQLAESGDCQDDIYIKKLTWPCIVNLNNPGTCTLIYEERMDYYMWACD